MSNTLYPTTTIILFPLLIANIITAGNPPQPPQEAQGWLSVLYHEGNKLLDRYAYVTDGAHLDILTYLEQASKTQGFHHNSNFLSQLDRSQKRTQRAGEQVLEYIHTRNIARLQQLQKYNKGGLPPYLVTAITTVTQPQQRGKQADLPPLPPTHTTGSIVLNYALSALGYASKCFDLKGYVLRPDAKRLAHYLEQVAQTGHCTDGNFAIQARRGLGRMDRVHTYLKRCITEQNPSAAQRALDHNRFFLPTAHVTLFQKAIDELHNTQEGPTGEPSPTLSSTSVTDGEDGITIITLDKSEEPSSE